MINYSEEQYFLMTRTDLEVVIFVLVVVQKYTINNAVISSIYGTIIIIIMFIRTIRMCSNLEIKVN